MNNVIDNNKCFGCGCCTFVCPTNAIKIVVDKDEGFFVPTVEKNKCISCGKCINYCPYSHDVELFMPEKVYALQRNGSNVLMSSSGGVTAALSEETIKSGGIVYGAIYENASVYHERITDLNELKKTAGSKYVQSDFSTVYRCVKDDLESGKDVCVVGTPCQIAGVKRFLGRDYKKLVCIDLICHGVPSVSLFDNYIKWIKRRCNAARIIDYKFRDKTAYGWNTTYTYTYIDRHGNTKKRSGRATEDPFFESYLYAETYRESCYNCKYAKAERVGDLTVGDYWGVLNFHDEFFDSVEKGVSLLLVNTQKGKTLFDSIAKDFYVIDSNLEYAALRNTSLIKPAIRPKIRDDIYKMINRYGIDWLYKRMKRKRRFYKNYIKNIIPGKLKKHIKHILKSIKPYYWY